MTNYTIDSIIVFRKGNEVKKYKKEKGGKRVENKKYSSKKIKELGEVIDALTKLGLKIGTLIAIIKMVIESIN